MSEENKKLVIMLTCGLESEKMSVAWLIANGAITNGLDVTVFLTSSAVDCVRKGAADKLNPNPLDPPVGEMIGSVLTRGGKVLVCPPCAKVRGYSEESFIPGVVVKGASGMFEPMKDGAATLCF
ncbi:MAG: DsrE family protein [Cyanobacteria bacterium J06632_22]